MSELWSSITIVFVTVCMGLCIVLGIKMSRPIDKDQLPLPTMKEVCIDDGRGSKQFVKVFYDQNGKILNVVPFYSRCDK